MNRKIELITNHSAEQIKGIPIENFLTFTDENNDPFHSFSYLLQNHHQYPIIVQGTVVSSKIPGAILEMIIYPVYYLQKQFYYLIARDIHSRLESEQLLRDSEKQYRLIADHIPDVTILMRIDPPQLLYSSPSCYDLVECSVCTDKENGVPSLQSLLPEKDANAVWHTILERKSRFQGGDLSVKSETRNIHLIHKNGTRIQTEMISTLIPDDHCEVNQVLFTFKRAVVPELPECHSSMLTYIGLWPKWH